MMPKIWEILLSPNSARYARRISIGSPNANDPKVAVPGHIELLHIQTFIHLW